ncbi:hypothetical protein CA13_56530 [Planctomycetes bacterium CA13]|uniref:Metal-binding protein n=1 Tax=Novipirellula herctigrandis TaxID=2527986 RepID=A0A5C5ZAQ4_9BACT|nr:hypothetical protein CA13_56530 [Planctomycetes bacterium CA13]
MSDSIQNPNSVHGHEIMHMMVAAGKPYTRDSLRTEIVEKYGEDARFHTCSASEMTAEDLISFLAERGKFVDSGDGFTTLPENICNH